MQAGPAYGTMRDEGYNFVAKNVFRNKADMDYYETECEAHSEYREFMKENAAIGGLKTMYFNPSLSYDF